LLTRVGTEVIFSLVQRDFMFPSGLVCNVWQITFRSEFWDLPSQCSIPWQEIFNNDEIITDGTGDSLQWRSFSIEATKDEEEAMDAFLFEAAASAEAETVKADDEEADTDQFLLEAASLFEAEEKAAEMEEEEEAVLVQAAEEADNDAMLIKAVEEAELDQLLLEAAQNF
jgi:hypothetical protein